MLQARPISDEVGHEMPSASRPTIELDAGAPSLEAQLRPGARQRQAHNQPPKDARRHLSVCPPNFPLLTSLMPNDVIVPEAACLLDDLVFGPLSPFSIAANLACQPLLECIQLGACQTRCSSELPCKPCFPSRRGIPQFLVQFLEAKQG